MFQFGFTRDVIGTLWYALRSRTCQSTYYGTGALGLTLSKLIWWPNRFLWKLGRFFPHKLYYNHKNIAASALAINEMDVGAFYLFYELWSPF